MTHDALSEPAAESLSQRILVIDDESVVNLSIRRILGGEGHQVKTCEDPERGLEMALKDDFDVVFLDLKMPGIEGMEILKALKAAGVSSEVVIITGHATVGSAVEAMKRGSADYLSKPFTPDQLRLVLQRVCQRSVLIRENASLRRELEVQQGFEGILGESRAMEKVFGLIRRVAPTDGTVLLTGESGTGKEVIVGAIHRLSRRGEKPLLACDCSALAPTLLESELFGHVKGSFSGAVATKQGLFEVAHHGTLFLDEVANLTLETQGKLLRVLESRQVRKVGDTAEKMIDIRLIAATNRDLSEMVRQQQFREDLYYRLNVVPLYLPPLRDREGDVPLLAMAFLERSCRKMQLECKAFTLEAMRLLESYSWPGNVRELRNIVERLAILCEGERIEPRHLPAEVRQALPRPTVGQLPTTWEEFKDFKQRCRDALVVDLERRFLTDALQRCEGNVSKAAADVGMQRTNFHALMRKCGVSGSDGVNE